MKTERSKKDGETGGAGRPDPFAVDIFERKAELSDISGITLETVKSLPLPEGMTRDWSSGLEVVSYGDAARQTQTPAYPHWFENEMNTAVLPRLAKLTGDERIRATFEVLSFADIACTDFEVGSIDESSVCFRFESGSSEGLFLVSAEFASTLIDKLLDGSGTVTSPRRSLTGIELSICEYLSTELLSAFNRSLDEAAGLRIKREAGNEPGIGKTGRGVEIVGDFVFGDVSGMVTIVVSNGLLEILNRAFAAAVISQRDLLADRFGDVIPETRLFLDVGSTTISAVEIPFLETGDVVLVTDPNRKWWDGDMNCPAVRCYVGSSSNLALEGKLSADRDGSQFRISEAVEAKGIRNYERIKKTNRVQGAKGVNEAREKGSPDEAGLESAVEEQVEEMPSEGGSAEGLVALENVMVDLRVLVAGRKISLNELGDLHAGQIIELGCRPEDPVELVAENSDRPIATGELLKIDEQLGVRITRVLV